MTKEADGLKDYMAEVSRRLEEHNQKAPLKLSISWGMSFFESGDIDTFMKEIDTRMYEMKETHHAREASEEASMQPSQALAQSIA